MKKVIIPILILGIAFIASCGPSAEEQAAELQRVTDSIATAEKAIADSVMAVQMQMMQDSLAAAEATRLAEEAAAASVKGGKPKAKPAPKVEEKPAPAPKNVKDAIKGSTGTKADSTTKPKNMKDALKNK